MLSHYNLIAQHVQISEWRPKPYEVRQVVKAFHFPDVEKSKKPIRATQTPLSPVKISTAINPLSPHVFNLTRSQEVPHTLPHRQLTQ